MRFSTLQNILVLITYVTSILLAYKEMLPVPHMVIIMFLIIITLYLQQIWKVIEINADKYNKYIEQNKN
jgi:Na+/H+ antiporter NhaC